MSFDGLDNVPAIAGSMNEAIRSPAGVRHLQESIEMEALLQRDLHRARPFEYAIETRGGCLEVDYRPMVREAVELLLVPGADIVRRAKYAPAGRRTLAPRRAAETGEATSKHPS